MKKQSTSKPSKPEASDETSDKASTPPDEVPTSNKAELAKKADIRKDFDATAAATKSELDKQHKVRMFVPLESGEPTGTILPVNVNGHRYNVPKGHTVEVPQTVAEIISESLNVPLSNLDLNNAPSDKKAALNV
jgi:alpha-galactosidase/6-phospho-beta-glucosidase family protein